MRVTLDYDPVTGELKDGGVFLIFLGHNIGFSPQALEGASSDNPPSKKEEVENLIALKSNGFDAQEIIQLKREGLV